MNKTALVIGYGSIGRKHSKILSSIGEIKEISVLTKQENIPFNKIKTLEEAVILNPDYVVIASETSLHYEQLYYLESNLKNKTILVEKPLFHENKIFTVSNNKVLVGYNLRFHPVINFIKQKIINKTTWNVNIFCGSNLENWRENINYENSSSAKKELGGGVLLDLSHELDYLNWLFGEICVDHAFNSKVSDLRINSDDLLYFSGSSNNQIRLQVTLNYFSKIPRRSILIDGEGFCLEADLIHNKVKFWEDGNLITNSYKSTSRDDSFKEMHLSVLSDKAYNVCSFKEGLKTMELIEIIREIAK